MRDEQAFRANRWVRALAAAGVLVGGLAAGGLRAQDVPGDQETVRRAVHVCAACHGEAGHSRTAGIPSLAGQMRQYTIAQLSDFRNQTRAETGTRAYMWGVSALLDDATIAGLADYYAAQAPTPGHAGHGVPAAALAQGRRIFTQGLPARGVRACASCHGDGAEGAAGFPRLAGQRADYVQAQLKVFGTRLRPHGVLMQGEARPLTAGEARAVSLYVQSL